MPRTLSLALLTLLLCACGERTAPPSAGPHSSGPRGAALPAQVGSVGSSSRSASDAVGSTPESSGTVAQPQPSQKTALPKDGAEGIDGGGGPGGAMPNAGAAASLRAAADVKMVAPVPPLFDDAGVPLGQTEERPPLHTPSFDRRIALLCEAIIADEPAKAEPAFFPVVAYQQVKDVQKPERDWKYRLWKAFERNIHEYHRELGRDADQARCEGIDIPLERARLMKPGSEANRLSYYRVLRSSLRMVDARGVARKLEVTSMISWRGEWYVVHLHGFE